MQEIADANGLSREDLLYRIHKPHVMSSKQNAKSVTNHLNPEELRQNFIDLLSITDYIISNIDQTLKNEENNKEDFENE